MKLILFVFIIVHFFISSLSYQCGWRTINNQSQLDLSSLNLDTILNGLPTKSKTQQPWLVRLSITLDNGRTGFATGSVVGKRWILTAGHSVMNMTTLVTLRPEQFRVQVGHNWTDSSQWYAVAEAIPHPQFGWQVTTSPSGSNFSRIIYDIGLLRLVDGLHFDRSPTEIQPICLMNSFDEHPFSSRPNWTQTQLDNQTERAEVVGYGYNAEILTYPPTFPPPDVPNMGHSRFMEPEYCLQQYFDEPDPMVTAQKWLCLWNQYKNDSWISIGDSGGPAIICTVQTVRGGRPVQERCAAVGTLSATTPTVIPESNEAPARYSRVSYYCPWIQNATNGEVHCVDPLDLQALRIRKNELENGRNKDKKKEKIN